MKTTMQNSNGTLDIIYVESKRSYSIQFMGMDGEGFTRRKLNATDIKKEMLDFLNSEA